jgi:hypothetical protein
MRLPHFTLALGSSWRFSLPRVGRKHRPKEWLSMRVRRNARFKWFQGQKALKDLNDARVSIF